MNIQRFQLALNNHEPKVVEQGLIEFINKVFLDHPKLHVHYGYHGRSYYPYDTMHNIEKEKMNDKIYDFLHPNAPLKVEGILNEYLSKSPIIEEFFILWNLPGRDLDKSLSTSHMQCISIILHCCIKSNISLCNTIVNRILNDYIKSIQHQLTSGNTSLVHATLGLIICMMRTSIQNCKDIYQKLNLASQSLDSIIQKGKSIKWICKSELNETMYTDSRSLMIVIVLLVLEALDDAQILELFAEKSLIRKIMHSVSRDIPETILILFHGMNYVIKHNQFISKHIHDIIDHATMKQIVTLYAHQDVKIQNIAHDFLTQLVSTMKYIQANRKNLKSMNSTSVQISINKCCSIITQGITPQSNQQQDEVLMSILAFQPSLIVKSIESISSSFKSWDSIDTNDCITALQYISNLLINIPIESKLKNNLRGLFSFSTSINTYNDDHSKEGVYQNSLVDQHLQLNTHNTLDQQLFINHLIHSWVPTGLIKKDVIKMINHKNISVQHVALTYIHALLQRILRIIQESGINFQSVGVSLEHCICYTLLNYIPDFQSIVNIRTKLIKLLQKTNKNSKQSSDVIIENKQESIELILQKENAVTSTSMDDFDFNIEVGNIPSDFINNLPANTSKNIKDVNFVNNNNINIDLEHLNNVTFNTESESLMNILLLEVIEGYITLIPQSVHQVKFDILRILDEYISWDITSSPEQVYQDIFLLNHNILLTVLKLLKQAMNRLDVRWFSSQDDTVKMLINLIVTEEWHITMKRTALMKLMLLSTCSHQSSGVENENRHSHHIQMKYKEVGQKAKSLLKLILIQSGLFIGHNIVDQELTLELNTWLNMISKQDHSILVLDSLFRLSFHWNAALALSGLTSLENLEQQGNKKLLPYSPVFNCCVQLVSVNFQIFATKLPNYVCVHIKTLNDQNNEENIDCTFFDKYIAKFRIIIEEMFMKSFINVVVNIKDNLLYCIEIIKTIEQTFHKRLLNIELKDFKIYQIVYSMSKLLNVFCNNTASLDKQMISNINNNLGNDILNYYPTQLLNIFQELLIINNNDNNNNTKTKTKLKENNNEINISNICYFPCLCVLVIEHWNLVQAFILNYSSNPSSVQSLQSNNINYFCIKYYKFMILLLLNQFKIKSIEFKVEFIDWLIQRWETDYEQSESLHMKTSLTIFVIQCLDALKVYNYHHIYNITTNGIISINIKATKSISKLNETSKHIVNTHVLFIPFLQVMLTTLKDWILNLSTTVMISQVLLDLHEVVLEDSWYGQFYRFLIIQSIPTPSSLSSTSSSSRHKLSHTGAMVNVWNKIALFLIKHKEQCFQSINKLEMLSFAKLILSVIDSIELQRIVIDESTIDSELTYNDFDIDTTLIVDMKHKKNVINSVKVTLVDINPIVEDMLKSLSYTNIIHLLSNFLMKDNDMMTKESNRTSLLNCKGYKIQSIHSQTSKQITYYTAPYHLISKYLINHNENSLVDSCIKMNLQVNKCKNSFLALTYNDQMISNNNQLIIFLIQVTTTYYFPQAINNCFTIFDLNKIKLNNIAKLLLVSYISNMKLNEFYNLVKDQKELYINQLIIYLKENIKNDFFFSIIDNLVQLIILMCEELQDYSLLLNYFILLIKNIPIHDDQKEIKFNNIFNNISLIIISIKIMIDLKYPKCNNNLHILWCNLYIQVLLHLLEEGGEYLISLSACENIPNHILIIQIKIILQKLSQLFDLSCENNLFYQAIQQYIDNQLIKKIKKKVNKFIKSMIKYGLEYVFLVDWVTNFIINLPTPSINNNNELSTNVFLLKYLIPEDSDFYSINSLFDLIPAHSKFIPILNLSIDRRNNINTDEEIRYALLALVLQLSLRKCSNSQESIINNDTSKYYLANIIIQIYHGTLSKVDRVCFRILNTLVLGKKCLPICSILPKNSIMNTNSLNRNSNENNVPISSQPCKVKTSEELLQLSSKWILEEITPPIVYSTLAKYPIWRSLNPQPFEWEKYTKKITNYSLTSSACDKEWSYCSNKINMDMEESSDELLDDTTYDDSDINFQFDPCLFYSDKVIDPAYYLQVLLFVLRNKEVSIRQLANCGALSIIIASLGSSCSVLRSYAIACLEYVHVMIHQQVPAKDPAFRERAQLVILLSYIKNTFDKDEIEITKKAPRLPLTTAIFLGRAAMNLMQPNHELYSRINKFILARPYCDSKDVPLFDVLLLSTGLDIPSDQIQRLSALRLLRDGLLTKSDHLNLCRKNAYNRLILLFPLIAKDIRAGHAILDLFDCGLSFKVSARYLLERCNIATWIKLLASPMKAMQLSAVCSLTHDATNTSIHSIINQNENSQYSKYLLRCLIILRRIIASSYLLVSEDHGSNELIDDLYQLLFSTCHDVCLAIKSGHSDVIPIEYFQHLLLCMWDMQYVYSQTYLTKSHYIWNIEIIYELYQAMEYKISSMHKQQIPELSTTKNTNDLLISLIGLLAYQQDVDSYSNVEAIQKNYLLHRLYDSCMKYLFENSSIHTDDKDKRTSDFYTIIQSNSISYSNTKNRNISIESISTSNYYLNITQYLAAVMSNNSILPQNHMNSTIEYKLNHKFEYTWMLLSTIDFNTLVYLPSSFGLNYIINLVAKLLFQNDNIFFKTFIHDGWDEFHCLRWVLFIWDAYFNNKHSIETLEDTQNECFELDMIKEVLYEDKSYLYSLTLDLKTISSIHLCRFICKLWLGIIDRRDMKYSTMIIAIFNCNILQQVMNHCLSILIKLQSISNNNSSMIEILKDNEHLINQLISYIFDTTSYLMTIFDNQINYDNKQSTIEILKLLEDNCKTLENFCFYFDNTFKMNYIEENKVSKDINNDMIDNINLFLSELNQSNPPNISSLSSILNKNNIGLTYIPHKDYRNSSKHNRKLKISSKINIPTENGIKESAIIYSNNKKRVLDENVEENKLKAIEDSDDYDSNTSCDNSYSMNNSGSDNDIDDIDDNNDDDIINNNGNEVEVVADHFDKTYKMTVIKNPQDKKIGLKKFKTEY